MSAMLGAGGLERVTSSLARLEHKDGVREASRDDFLILKLGVPERKTEKASFKIAL